MAVARRRTLRQRENLEFYLFISPWLVGFVVFVAGPMLATFAFSFASWDLLTAPKFVGLANYAKMLAEDPLFWKALQVSAIYSLVGIPLHIAFALLVAILLNQNIRAVALIRTIYYMPSVLSGVAVAVLWLWIFNPNFGPINLILKTIGVEGPLWLGSQTWALPALIIVSLWGVGGAMVIFLAGLQGIPTALYEAAAIDGANAWHRFWHVTVPMISPVLFFNLVMGIINSFQAFTNAYVMTQGGPNYATLMYVLYLYQNGFRFFQMGYASALAWVLFLLILLLTLLVFRSSPAWVYYEGELRGRR
ncbi:MAG TPA: sugar ABC transporter permease [Chloroflexota bacterium]|jgi:multiple sugar transport system permease protein|nr:sugar ABC transporter permease [Chloroflexota bacterium]